MFDALSRLGLTYSADLPSAIATPVDLGRSL